MTPEMYKFLKDKRLLTLPYNSLSSYCIFGESNNHFLRDAYCFYQFKFTNIFNEQINNKFFWLHTSTYGRKPSNGESGEERNYYKWLLNDSIWSDVFLTKDPKEFIIQGGWLQTKLPTEFVVSAAVAARYPTDFPKLITNFLILKEHIPDMYALFLSHFYDENLHKGSYYNPGHYCFTNNRNKVALKNFLNNDRKYFNKCSLFKDKINFSYLNKCWTPGVVAPEYSHAIYPFYNELPNEIEDNKKNLNSAYKIVEDYVNG